MKRSARIQRRNKIIIAFVRAVGPDFWNPLPPMWAASVVRAVIPDTDEREIFEAVRWGIRQSKRSGARFEREQVRRADRCRGPDLKWE